LLAALASASVFLAKGLGFLLVSLVVRGTDTPSVARASSPDRSGHAVSNNSERHAAHAILARNIFDPQTGPLWPPPRTETPAPSLPPAPSDEHCDIGTRLAAIFYDRREPALSWIVLRGSVVGSGPRTFTRGMAVGDRMVDDIQPEAARLVDHVGRGCWLAMFTPQSRAELARERAAENPRKPRARKRRNAEPAFAPQELQAGIRPLGNNRYAIRRHLIEKARANAANITQTTRVVPARGKDGGYGLRVARLRKGGLLTHLGLRRGDIVRSINGVVMSDVGKLLGAYAKLDRTNRVALSVSRQRKNLLLEYYVQ
jgi:hypothetical protein